MRSLARDIQFTLLIKFLLLIILWVVCFRNVQKPSTDVQQWMFSQKVSTHKSPAVPHMDKN